MYEFAVTPAVTQLRRPGVIVTAVAVDSLGEEIGIEPNDRIVKVNGRSIRDYLDFRFQTSGETELELTVRKANGETWQIELDREEGEDFGIEFEQIVPRQCANECLFCFCKGNPADARPSLFVRDEDIRLSFLYGNYTTMSSIKPDEMKRIVEQRLSPQYVSVHATDLKTRAFLLGVDEKRADISDKIRFLLDNDIEIHAQIVLCPGINDGPILEKSLRDLAADHPKIVSTAIVPVALTRYNTDERLSRISPEFCRNTIELVERLQKEFRKRLGVTFAFLGDEIYLRAGRPIPSRRHYGNYPQIEDGVGMIRSFTNSFESMLAGIQDGNGSRRRPAKNVRTHLAAFTPTGSGIPAGRPDSRKGTVFSGELFAPTLSELVQRSNSLTDLHLKVAAVQNRYFGGDVSVAGLLTGQDYLDARDLVEGDFVIIPKHTIKSDEPILLDGMTFSELQKNYPVPIFPMDTDEFLAYIRGAAA